MHRMNYVKFKSLIKNLNKTYIKIHLLVLLRPHDRLIDQATTHYVVVLMPAYMLALKRPHSNT